MRRGYNWNERKQPRTEREKGETLRDTALRLEIVVTNDRLN